MENELVAAQVMVDGIQQAGEGGVFVTFEESPRGIRQIMASVNWDIARWKTAARWAFTGGHDQKLPRIHHRPDSLH
jgi:KaiC/GvpD/RAD55 family RecA-like ATPase